MSANHRYSIQPAGAHARLTLSTLAVMACTVLTACSGLSSTSVNPVNWITPYKIDVIQGNFISSEQVAVLQPGMTRAQVKEVLGTPLLASLFHADRWDYVFSLKRQGVESQSYKYTVYFKGDALERFEGDTMPSEADFISKLGNKRKLGKVPPLLATEDQLKNAEKGGSGRPASTGISADSGVPPSPQITIYPPLESARP